jgi:hypothetical protein
MKQEKIKRYSFKVINHIFQGLIAEPFLSVCGAWVEYEDHRQHIKQLEKKYNELKNKESAWEMWQRLSRNVKFLRLLANYFLHIRVNEEKLLNELMKRSEPEAIEIMTNIEKELENAK